MLACTFISVMHNSITVDSLGFFWFLGSELSVPRQVAYLLWAVVMISTARHVTSLLRFCGKRILYIYRAPPTSYRCFLTQTYYPSSCAKHQKIPFPPSQVGKKGPSFPQRFPRRKVSPQNPLTAPDSKTYLLRNCNKNNNKRQAPVTLCFMAVKGAFVCTPSPALHTVTADRISAACQSLAPHRSSPPEPLTPHLFH